MIKGGNKLPPFYFSFLTKFLMYFSFSLFARQRFFTSLPNLYCYYKSVLFTPKVPKERESTLLFSTTLRLFFLAGRACTFHLLSWLNATRSRRKVWLLCYKSFFCQALPDLQVTSPIKRK